MTNSTLAMVIVVASMFLGYGIDKTPNGDGAIFWTIGFVAGAVASALITYELMRKR